MSRLDCGERVCSSPSASPEVFGRTSLLRPFFNATMHNTRLLIADSNPEMAVVYDRFFGQDGYDVVTVADGLECITGLRDFAPKVLVVEHELPWGGGDGVVALMRADCRLSRVPVVIVYGSDSFDSSSEFVQLPVVAHLRKPFKLSTLSERIRAAYGANDCAAQH